MNKALTLSIVIPVYNDERYLKACLDSIAAQTEMPDEVIVVDNNCTDGSMAVAQRYSFVTVVTEHEQGKVYARNAGFDAVKSDLIGRIDADTILTKAWVKRVRQFYGDPQNAERGLTGGGKFYNIRAPGFTSWLQDQAAYRTNRFILGHYILWGSNMAIPTQLWHKVRGHVCLRDDIHEDLDLAIHLNKRGFKITYKEGLRVGVAARRLVSNRNELWGNLLLWPQTVKVHNKKRWIWGWVGAVLLYILSFLAPVAEKFSRFIGRPALPQ